MSGLTFQIFGLGVTMLVLAIAGAIEPGYHAGKGDGVRFPGYHNGDGYSQELYGDHQYNSGKGEEPYQKNSKYYYGGQYKDSCQGDGLYYKNDNTFVICSNGYSHEQPCPPGTKTAGYPSYKAGYYYGYTDLCSVNLVDYGLGPEHYAPTGYADNKESYGNKDVGYEKRAGYGPKGAAYGHNKDKDYASGPSNYAHQKDSYASSYSSSYSRVPADGYPSLVGGSYGSSPHGSYPQVGGYGEYAKDQNEVYSQHRPYSPNSDYHSKNQYNGPK